jgi:hypothetical protein
MITGIKLNSMKYGELKMKLQLIVFLWFNLLTYLSQAHRYPLPQSHITTFAKFICYTGIEPN